MAKKVYISAPITGIDTETVDRVFTEKETLLSGQGYEVINPMRLQESLTGEPTYGQYMGLDIEHLIDRADTVYFCKGWKKSKGCMLEFHAAIIYSKKIILE